MYSIKQAYKDYNKLIKATKPKKSTKLTKLTNPTYTLTDYINDMGTMYSYLMFKHWENKFK